MTAPDFDLFVIGAGSGGVRAARIAASHGARVAIAEESRVGGTCVIRGCVPKKFLVFASRFADDFADSAGYGWTVSPPTFDWPTLIAHKDAAILRLEGIYNANLEGSGVKVFHTRAIIDGPGRVRLPNLGSTVTAKTILVATGARPHRDRTVAGIEHAITSDDALELPTQPRNIVIVGGGYIAIEFACIFNGLGSKVTLLHRGDKLLRGFDDDLRVELSAAIRARGIDLRTHTKLEAITKSGGTTIATLASGETILCDHVMVATGRHPNTADLGLETVGVTLGHNDRIVVDDHSRSSAPDIYAVGDVTDRVNLTPVAIREGHAFADTLYGNKPWVVDRTLVPSGVFSTPEAGGVGLSEEAARAAYPKIDIYKTHFRSMRNVLAERDEKMLMKLVVDGATDRVLGCHILGPDAAEIIQMAAIALGMRATKADFDRTVALHPSVAEELVTLRTKWVPSA